MKETTDHTGLFQRDANISFTAAFPLALQHVLAAFIGIVTPAIVVAGACGLNEADATLLIQMSIFMSGIVTLLQATPLFGKYGSSLPLIVGSSIAYVPTMVSIGGRFGISAIFGSVVVGSLVMILFAHFIKPITKIFPTVVAGTVIFCIGVSLYTTGVSYMAGGQLSADFGSLKNWIVAFITMFSVILFEYYGPGDAKLSGILFGIIVGYLVSIPLGMIEIGALAQADLIAIPQVLPFGMTFVPAAMASMAIISIPVAVESCGDMSATTMATQNRCAKISEFKGGLLSEALVDLLGCVFGGFPHAIFGQNVGLVTTNKVVNKTVFTLSGIIFLIAGISPKVAALFTTIPQSVVGGAVITLFGMITLTGIRVLTQGEGLTPRRSTIAGLSAALGMGVVFVPGSLAGPGMPYWVAPIFGSAVVLPTICSVVLNLILPGQEEEIQYCAENN